MGLGFDIVVASAVFVIFIALTSRNYAISSAMSRFPLKGS